MGHDAMGGQADTRRAPARHLLFLLMGALLSTAGVSADTNVFWHYDTAG